MFNFRWMYFANKKQRKLKNLSENQKRKTSVNMESQETQQNKIEKQNKEFIIKDGSNNVQNSTEGLEKTNDGFISEEDKVLHVESSVITK